ncbi:winged helix-turn-helix domain-containing protein [Rubrobacter xylanophilus]
MATTHLSKARLIERPRRGYLRITERGLSLSGRDRRS